MGYGCLDWGKIWEKSKPSNWKNQNACFVKQNINFPAKVMIFKTDCEEKMRESLGKKLNCF